MLFLSAKLGFYHNIHNILNMNMLIQCADLIFKQHDRKLQEPNVYHRVLQLEVNHGIILDYSPGDTYPNKSLSCDRHNPRCLVWHIPRYPQISPACTHSLLMRCLPTECSLVSSPWRLMNGEILSLGTFLSWKWGILGDFQLQIEPVVINFPDLHMVHS